MCKLKELIKYFNNMKLFSKKLDLITTIAIAFMAISISILDFDNLTWNNNIKSYMGIIIFVILISVRYLIKKSFK